MRLGLYKRSPAFMSGYRTRRIKFKMIFYLFILLLLVLSYLFFERVYPNFMSRVEVYANNLATVTINNTLSEVLKSGFNETKFVDVVSGTDGRVTSVKADTMAMNTFKAELADKLLEKVNTLPDGYVTLPLGSLSKKEIFSGIGPRIRIKIVPNGMAKVDFSEEFISCGINQVKHKIVLDVSLTVTLISATMRKAQTVHTTVPVSETIISGVVPNYYGGNMNFAATPGSESK